MNHIIFVSVAFGFTITLLSLSLLCAFLRYRSQLNNLNSKKNLNHKKSMIKSTIK